MKNFIRVTLLIAITSVFLVGCTEQQVKPRTGGGAVSDPTGTK